MKKLIIIFCIACISAGATAQPSGVRIGSYVFHVQKASSDSLTNVFAEDDPCPPCPSENETRPKVNPFSRRTYTDSFCGIGFILPDNGNNYYTTLGGNSINIDVGGIRVYHLSRHFALGGTMQYSFYNYKFRDAVNEENFNTVVLRNEIFANDDLRKQVYRSHNVTVGLFTRLYLVPGYRYHRGLYVDLGAQGDFAFSRYCMLKTQSDKKKRYHEDYAFNPFSASAIVRIGWDKFLPGRSAIFARYRFTDAFNRKSLPMDLPPITIGIQFF